MGNIERTLAKLKQRQANQVPTEANVTLGEEVSNRHNFAAESDLSQKARPLNLDVALLADRRIMSPRGSDLGSAAYKMLRTRILHRMRSNGWRTLAITSPRANAGKTLTAINTAISLAQDPNQQVALVDLDLRNPRVASYLGVGCTLGVVDHLTRGARLEDVIVKSRTANLCALLNAEVVDHSSELLASPQVAELVRQLSEAFSIVIFDMPPLLEADDMLAFSPLVDASLFVVAQGETSRADVEKSSELLKEDLSVLGVVLNKSDERAPGYY